MRENSKINKKIEWSQYSSPGLYLEKRRRYKSSSFISCGSSAIGIVTGIHPEIVEKSCKNPNTGWYTGNVIKFLRSKGYTVIELSKNGILKSGWMDFPIRENHCLMMNTRMDGKENSMFVLHKDRLWHNYEDETESWLNNLFFINKPTQDVLLIYHKKWKYGKRFSLRFNITSCC